MARVIALAINPHYAIKLQDRKDLSEEIKLRRLKDLRIIIKLSPIKDLCGQIKIIIIERNKDRHLSLSFIFSFTYILYMVDFHLL